MCSIADDPAVFIIMLITDSVFYSLLPVVKEVLDTVVGIVFGVTPSQMSLLYFLHYLHCAGGWSVIVDPDTKGYAQEWRIKVKKN